MRPKALIKLARPEHWVKNLIVLAPVLFARRTGDPVAWILAGLAAGAFCLASSAVYVFNDIRDREADRRHPRKKDRPLASGAVSVRAAAAECVVLLAGAAGLGFAANPFVLATVGLYVLLQAAYSLVLKHRMLVDVICIALGFVLRAMAGALAIRVEISPWLFVCTFTLCLFLGFCKRCNELVTMGADDDAFAHRRTLAGYTPELLTHLITLSAAVSVVAFLSYALSDRTVENLGTNFLVYTLPVVVYVVFRFAMLSMRGRYADPTDLITHDRPFQLVSLLWLAMVVVVIRWGRQLQEFARQRLWD